MVKPKWRLSRTLAHPAIQATLVRPCSRVYLSPYPTLKFILVDMSPSLFKHFASLGKGVISVKWEFVWWSVGESLPTGLVIKKRITGLGFITTLGYLWYRLPSISASTDTVLPFESLRVQHSHLVTHTGCWSVIWMHWVVVSLPRKDQLPDTLLALDTTWMCQHPYHCNTLQISQQHMLYW